MILLWLIFFLLLSPTAWGASVTWSNSRTGDTGTAVGTTNWTIGTSPNPGIPLLPGTNPITVTGTDSNGNTGSDSITVTYAPIFPGNTLAGAWGFNDGSGITALDSSINSNTGSLLNGAALTNTIHVHDKGILLDGVDDYMRVLDHNSLDFTRSFTLSAWVTLPDISDTQGFQPIFTKGQSYNTSSDWPVQFLYAAGMSNTSIDPACTSGSIQAGFVPNGKDGHLQLICGPPIQTNTPTFIAVTYNGTILSLAVSGRSTITKAANGYMEPTDDQLRIGLSDYDEHLRGTVSSPRIYNWPLPAGSNPGGACQYVNYTTTVQGNQNLATLADDENCAIIPLTPPPVNRFPAAPDALKIGAGAVVRLGASP